MKNIQIKNIALTAGSEYMRWLGNPKILLLAVVVLPMRDVVIMPMLEAAEKMDSPVNLLEPCIAVANSWLGLLLMALIYMIFMSSFPTMDGNMLFYMARMGRKNWMLGEMLFQVLAVVTFNSIIIAVSMGQAAKDTFLANGWSLAVTDYDGLYGAVGGFKMAEIIPPNLYFQMSPVMAFLLSYALLSLFLLLCGFIFLAGCLYQKRLLLFLLQVLHITVGCGLILIRSQGMWLFPVSHSMLACHYRKYFREYMFDPWWSLALFILAVLLLMSIMYRKAGNVSLDMIGGDVLP